MNCLRKKKVMGRAEATVLPPASTTRAPTECDPRSTKVMVAVVDDDAGPMGWPSKVMTTFSVFLSGG